MTEKLELEIVNKYPELYSEYGGDMAHTAMHWGFQCGDGWVSIISGMTEKLSKLNIPELKITTVKEKFGALRVYTNIFTDEINEIIMEAEKFSETVCESCGTLGELKRRGYWLLTRCDDCYERNA